MVFLSIWFPVPNLIVAAGLSGMMRARLDVPSRSSATLAFFLHNLERFVDALKRFIGSFYLFLKSGLFFLEIFQEIFFLRGGQLVKVDQAHCKDAHRPLPDWILIERSSCIAFKLSNLLRSADRLQASQTSACR
jgi:hypothetical protein